MRIVGRVGRVEVGMDDGDWEASVVNDVCELNHGVYVALEGQWEEHSSATLSLLQLDICWLFHRGASSLLLHHALKGHRSIMTWKFEGTICWLTNQGQLFSIPDMCLGINDRVKIDSSPCWAWHVWNAFIRLSVKVSPGIFPSRDTLSILKFFLTPRESEI